jgi:tight adherence protein C
MSIAPAIVGRWLLGLAWGALAAAPFVVRARRRRVGERLVPLRPARPDPTPLRLSALRRLVARAHASPIGAMALRLQTRRRDRRDDTVLASELPVTLDLLAVAVDAGCTPYLAIEQAARWAPPAMAARLADVRGACALGAPFADALDDLAARAPRLRPLADALLASDRLGAPVGPALARLATEQRAELRRRAETQARRVPVRLLFPLVFVVLPAFGLLTVIPTLLAGFSRI